MDMDVLDHDPCLVPIPMSTTNLQVFIYSFLIPIICLMGAIAALCCVMIFTRRQMRSSSLNILLAGLSIFDFILLSSSLFIYLPMIVCIQQDSTGLVCHFFWRTALVTYPLSLAAQSASVWTCVTLTADRFIAVQYPLRLRSMRTTRNAVIVLILLTIASSIYKIPAIFEVDLDECGRLVQTQLRQNEAFFHFYYAYSYVLLMLAVPWALMMVLNAIVLIAVHRAMKIRRAISTSQTDERRCTMMVIVIIATFICFNLPAGINHVLEAMQVANEFRQNLIPIANLLVCVNSASNILIYCLFGKKFRHVLIVLFCPCLSHVDQGYTMTIDEKNSLIRRRSNTSIIQKSHRVTHSTINPIQSSDNTKQHKKHRHEQKLTRPIVRMCSDPGQSPSNDHWNIPEMVSQNPTMNSADQRIEPSIEFAE